MRRGPEIGWSHILQPLGEAAAQMTQCHSRIEWGNIHGKQITCGFEGGDISTDGGLILVLFIQRHSSARFAGAGTENPQ